MNTKTIPTTSTTPRTPTTPTIPTTPTTPNTNPEFLLGWAYAIIWVATIVAFLGAVALW
jgi:hypothetical protein